MTKANLHNLKGFRVPGAACSFGGKENPSTSKQFLHPDSTPDGHTGESQLAMKGEPTIDKWSDNWLEKAIIHGP